MCNNRFIAQVSGNNVTYEVSIFLSTKTFRLRFLFYGGRFTLESKSDIFWKHTELIFFNTASPITQCSSARAPRPAIR